MEYFKSFACLNLFASPYQLLDLLELLGVGVDGHELVVVLDLGGMRVRRRPVRHPLQVRQSSEAFTIQDFVILWATLANFGLFGQSRKQRKLFFLLREKEAKMIVLLLGVPCQKCPKLIAALKMKSLGFCFFIRLFFSKLRIGQRCIMKYAMLLAQSSSCIKHVRERSSNLLKVHTPH